MKSLPGELQMNSKQVLLFVVLFLFSTLGLRAQVTTVSNTAAATVTSDQEDYAPRSNAVFTGANFSPGETVVLKVKNLNSPCNTVNPDSSYLPWSATADASGGFVTNWTVCDCNGDSLRLKATGQTSGSVAYAYFKDAARPGSISIGSQNGTASFGTASSVTFSITITRDGNGGGGFTTNLTANGLPTGVSISPASVSFSGNINTVTTSVTVTSLSTTPAGNYQSFSITASGIPARTSNATTYSINKAEQHITWADPADILYGTALSATQLNAVATGGASITYDPALGAILSAGTHILKVTAGETSNFKERTREVNIIVLPKPITLTASDQSKTYGAAHLLGTTAFTLNASTPMAAGESIASVTLTSAGAAAAAAAGNYAIVASGALSGPNTSLSNYAVTYADGTLTVSKASTTTIVTVANATYDGTAHGGSAGVTGAWGLNQAVIVSYTGVSPTVYAATSTPPTNAGTYNATATYAESANHLGSSDSKTFTIEKAATTTLVTINGGPFTYTGLAHTPATVSVTGAGGLSLTPAAIYADNTNAGTATASYSYVESANHLASSDSKTFTIDKAATTTVVTINGGPFTYTGSAHTPATVSVTGAGGLNLTPMAAYADNVNAGTASASYNYPGNDNYEASSDSKSFIIGKAATVTTVTIAPGTFTYTGSAHTPASVSVTGAGGLNLSPTAAYADNINAGTATASYTYAESANHFASSDSKTFTINKAATTTVVTINGGPFTYTGSAHTPATVSVTGAGGLNLTPPADYSNNVNAGTATASYNYTESANHLASSDSKTFIIGKAGTTTVVTINGGPFTYTGLAHTPASVLVTGAGGLSLTPNATYSDNVNTGTATAGYNYAESANHLSSSDSKTFIIGKALLTVTANNLGDNASKVQYSDLVPAFTATISGFKNGETLATSGVTGYPSFATEALIVNGKVESPSGTYKITPGPGSLAAANYDFNAASFIQGDLIVQKEDAEIVYSGLEYFTTDGATSNAAKVEFMASLKDSDDGIATRGNISRAVVDFSATGGLTLAAPTTNTPGTLTQRTVGLVDPADQTVGLARTELLKVLLSTAEVKDGGKIVELNAEVRATPTNSFYNGTMAPKTGAINSNSEKTLITIAMPGQDFVSGGGHVIATNPAGSYAAELNTRVKFGFTMKWNKSGKNIQGQTTVIFRKMVGNVLKTYQIKSNSINSLGTANVTGGRRADFNTKATLTDVTDELNPITVSGNLDLTMQAFESTNPSVPSEISITLRNGSLLLFSSHWDKNTSARKGLGKGAIRILNASTPTSTTARMTSPAPALQPEFAAQFESYPNPFSNAAAFRFVLETDQDYELAIYDTRGMLVKRVETGRAEAGKLYEVNLDGKYLAQGIYVARLITSHGVKLLRIVKQ
ncbi:T9SS type A sorting domain-containing protein [Adhaeribacter sp. BT258]|uniref:T9SS type A sorting domain-containing protein n=1 Tax=Adhaeribacter terrigena TaxID=2793070 RepID=A0ABS1BYB8_9BACT|nr:MBG domain-containing protein [Adhaeribacter terrigena]MBK0402160.1 T9SS type A sorting domain-containing protein [Adhaeribacter terrigena]